MKQILFCLIVLSNLVCASQDIDNSLDKLFDIVPQQHEIQYKGKIYEIDMKALLEHTASIESNYGLDNYKKNKHAISQFQYEKQTVVWAMKVSKELVEYFEDQLGCKIDYKSGKHSAYVTYIIYMSKIRYHSNWLTKVKVEGDLDWKIYKIFWNSTKGASTYKKWKQRKVEMEVRRIEKLSNK
ncbi:MAG: hypothetical protein ACRDDY_03790 [Clostridium sp.]|uniref:hypothetical protein n=1 Tax=Clostridium sp. TaxID=1506 RepID=UPI003EE72A64